MDNVNKIVTIVGLVLEKSWEIKGIYTDRQRGINAFNALAEKYNDIFIQEMRLNKLYKVGLNVK